MKNKRRKSANPKYSTLRTERLTVTKGCRRRSEEQKRGEGGGCVGVGVLPLLHAMEARRLPLFILFGCDAFLFLFL